MASSSWIQSRDIISLSQPQHRAAAKPTSPNASISTQSHDRMEEEAGTDRQLQYLPTPTSLPHLSQLSNPLNSMSGAISNDAVGLFARPNDPSGNEEPAGTSMEQSEDEFQGSGSERKGQEDREGGLPFEIEMEELDTDLEEIDQSHLNMIAAPFSSTHRPQRIARARYASSNSSAPSPPPLVRSEEHIMSEDIPSSHKRTFSHVSISTGMTPPVLERASFETLPFLASPPASPSLDSSYQLSPDLPTSSSSLSSDLDNHPLFRSTASTASNHDPASNDSALPSQHRPYVHSRARTHSFESQRASTARASGRRNLLEVTRESIEGEMSRASSLRRRSPTSRRSEDGEVRRSDLERGGSKRRRASTLLNGGEVEIAHTTSAGGTQHQGSQSFAPALGRYPPQAQAVEPVLSRPSPPASPDSSAHRQPSFSRLPPWWRNASITHVAASDPQVTDREGFASGSSTSYLPTPPLVPPVSNASTSSSFLRPRSSRTARPRFSLDSVATFTNDAQLHSAQSRHLHRQNDEILREAEQTLRSRQSILRAAEETTRDARRLLIQDREDRERERRINDLPSAGTLPPPAELAARPVIGVRVGEGWPSATNMNAIGGDSPRLPQTRRRRSSLFSISPPSSPDEEANSPDSTEGTSSRARQFLTQLRSRRPRFSRNSTIIPPPSVVAPDVPSPTLADSLVGSTFDEQAERHVAAELNDRLLERRRVSASLESPAQPDPRPGLWGETLSRTSRSRMRGPTATENERWRRGEAPLLLSGSTTPALIASTAQPPFSTSVASGTVTPLSASSSTSSNPPQIGNEATDVAATAYFARRDDSPSPLRGGNRTESLFRRAIDLDEIPTDLSEGERRRDRSLSRRTEDQRALFPTLSSGVGGHGTGSVTTLERALSADGSRPSIRFARPDLSAQSASSASSRPRLRFDDEDDASPQHATDGSTTSSRPIWNPPHLPLMLPSGSAGRRMVFPHPANAAGASDGLEAAEEGRAGEEEEDDEEAGIERFFGTFGPNHLEGNSNDMRDRPTVGFQASRYSRPLPNARRLMPWDDQALPSSRFNPFGDLPAPTTTTSSADAARRASLFPDSAANSRTIPAQASLADALATDGARPSPGDATSSSTSNLRRRHQGSLATSVDSASPFATLEQQRDSQVDSVADRLAQHRQSRLERLASLRRERTFMRTILGGAAPGGDGASTSTMATSPPLRATSVSPERTAWRDRIRDRMDTEQERRDANLASPPRSPGALRRRGLGDFFRGLGTGGRLISMFDEDYGAFFGRDAVALDSRNYLEDDEFDSSYEALLRLSAQIGDVKPKGVGAEALSKLRTFPYSQWPYIDHSSSSPVKGSPIASTSANKIEEDKPEFARKGIDKEVACSVCLSDYEEEDEIALAHCSHGFHADCLKAWLKDHGSCPVCRRNHAA